MTSSERRTGPGIPQADFAFRKIFEPVAGKGISEIRPKTVPDGEIALRVSPFVSRSWDQSTKRFFVHALFRGVSSNEGTLLVAARLATDFDGNPAVVDESGSTRPDVTRVMLSRSGTMHVLEGDQHVLYSSLLTIAQGAREYDPLPGEPAMTHLQKVHAAGGLSDPEGISAEEIIRGIDYILGC